MYLLFDWRQFNFVNVRGFYFCMNYTINKNIERGGGMHTNMQQPRGQQLYNCELLQFSACLIINIIQKYIIYPTTIYHNMK
jgi:hypothetical protein